MNRFRTKKKVKEEVAASISRASSDEQHTFMGFLRKQKAPEEEKTQIDIASVLPPSDDFRTSLLMTGLSARFSMLREQDDPNTKIGKASDDSVLCPKRQSKLMDYGFRGLDDIAEVESIRAPAPFMRTGSFTSDTDSVQDSIMNRTRPTEGNNLFGGRQKIYRIPAGSASSKNVAEGGMGGRALYENDVNFSAFQKLRQERKERFLEYESELQANITAATNGQFLLSTDTYDQYSPYQRSESPSPNEYNLRRETSSTTSSGARNSTAATSVTSQPGTTSKDWQPSSSQAPSSSTGSTTPSGITVERMPTFRIRRLYEQGLNQDLHEQQSSALSRMDTLSGKRTLGTHTPDLAAAPSPTNSFGFGDRMGSTNGTVMSTLERLERRQILTKASAPNLRSMSPPCSSSSLGVGAPAESKNAFPTSPPLSPPMGKTGEEDTEQATAQGFEKPALPYDDSRFARRQVQAQHDFESPAEHTLPSFDIDPKGQTTFLFDDGDNTRDTFSYLKTAPSDVPNPQVLLQRPSDAEHPAFRQSAMPTPLSPSRSTGNLFTSVPDAPESFAIAKKAVLGKQNGGPAFDSPTLGPGSGLNGMVFQHLRSTSNASSIYSTASPRNSVFDESVTNNQVDTNITSGDVDLTVGQPWDDQNWTASVYSSISASDKRSDLEPPSNPPPPPPPPPKIATQRPPIPEAPKNKYADVETTRAPSLRSVSSRSRITSVADSNRSSNNLDAENEDSEFASQLANARKRVQERLTTYVESDTSFSTSPLLPPTEPAPQLPVKSNPLGILRSKSSRGSLLDRSRDVSQSKSLKKLGISSPIASTSPSPSRPSFEDIGTFPRQAASASPLTDEFSLEALTKEREEKQWLSQENSRFGRSPASVPASASPTDQSSKSALRATSTPRLSAESDTGDADEEAASSATAANGENTIVHPGLRAFRSARRQLQKRKELEVQARNQDDRAIAHSVNGSSPPAASAEAASRNPQSPPRRERRPTLSSGPPSRERKPPPVYYQQRDHSQESRTSSNGIAGGRSRSGSRTSGQTERDRSGSEASNGGGYRRLAPPKIRTNQGVPSYDSLQYHQPSPNANNHDQLGLSGLQDVSVRSPGLPLTETRRAPQISPQPYLDGYGNEPSMNGLSVQVTAGGRSTTGYSTPSGQPSPISPSFLGNNKASTPAGYSTSATTSTLNESAKKMFRKNDSSEPSTLLSSTSRLPIASLPHSTSAPDMVPNGKMGGSRSRSNSRVKMGSNAAVPGFVPPLPPISPLRKQSGPRTARGLMSGVLGGGRRGDGRTDDMDTMSALTMPAIPPSSSSSSANLAVKAPKYAYGAGSTSDNEGYYEQRTLRKQASEASGMHSRMAGMHGQQTDFLGGMI
ncbi:hypothetical protein SEPCBS57363_006603 [Sporothrix epigloea]|uniref:Proteophosphoglycan ppg4 n=1 Tax=Sporothrix epigloea TaxID=1892477 RepID=A0ABP0E3X0_9PEZI